MNNALKYDLQRLLARVQPQSLLLVGEGAYRLGAGYLSEHPDCAWTQAHDLEQLIAANAEQPYDLALVVDALEHTGKSEALAMLARLRDVLSRQVIVVVPVGETVPGIASSWVAEDLIAMGMYRAGLYEEERRTLHVYCFDLYDYKSTPDWLNARYWAHPELFDKYWW